MDYLLTFFNRLRAISPRLLPWIVLCIAGVFMMLIAAPAQVPVVIYKVALVVAAAVIGYWLDRSLYPYARPDIYLLSGVGDGASYEIRKNYELVFALAMLRRALIVFAVILGIALGL